MPLAKLMKITRGSRLSYVPASHEDPKDPGSQKKVLVKKGEVQKGDLQMVNWSLLPAGRSFRPHYHEDLEEIFVIISGKVVVTADGAKAVLKKGDSVCIPPRTVHTMSNPGRTDALFLAIGVASGKNGKTVVVT